MDSRRKEDPEFGRLEHRGETERKRAQVDLKRFGRRAKQDVGS
jgi:hypothetical protein